MRAPLIVNRLGAGGCLLRRERAGQRGSGDGRELPEDEALPAGEYLPLAARLRCVGRAENIAEALTFIFWRILHPPAGMIDAA